MKFWLKIVNALKCTRKWLEENKVFFTTIAAILLSVMAIIVSWQTNLITQEQTKVIQREQLPSIRMEVSLPAYDVETGETSGRDILYIYNNGAPIYEFNIENMVFIEICYTENHENMRSVLYPILGYYNSTTIPARSTGAIAYIFSNEESWYKFDEVDQAFRKFAENNNGFGCLLLQRYIIFEYTDVFNEYHSEIYHYDRYHYSTKLLNSEEEKQLLELVDNAYANEGLWVFGQITPEILLEKWKQLK